jgi:hypothetical protein
MVQEGVMWFGSTQPVSIAVIVINNASVSTYSIPYILNPGQQYQISITVQNTGTTIWSNPYQLNSISLFSQSLGISQLNLPTGTKIQPNALYTFITTFTAPSESGIHSISYQMWNGSSYFGSILTFDIVISIVLDSFPWISLTCKRATSDLAWQFDISLHGTDILPVMFRRLEYEPTPFICAMLGVPVETQFDSKFPTITSTITAYSYGYFLKDFLQYKYRQTYAGVDIPTWERSGSNYAGETSRTNEILSYENPSYHLIRLLWPLDSNGNITNQAGYYDLYLGRVELVPNWGLGTGPAVKVTQSLASNGTLLYVADLSVFPSPSSSSFVQIFTYTDNNNSGGYDDGDTILSYEVCQYTAKSAASGSGYLTIIRSGTNVWNPSSAVVQHMDTGYDVNHISVPKKQYSHDGGKTIKDVLDLYTKDCGMIYFTEFKLDNGVWKEYFYWIPSYRLEEDKGNYLNLPDILTITPDNANLIGDPGLSATIGMDESFNAVCVESCRKKDAGWFYAYAEKPEVTIGNEVRHVLLFRSDDLLPDCAGTTWSTTVDANSNYGPVTDGGVSYGTAAENTICQNIVNNKALELLKYCDYTIPSYSVEFKNSFFQLYQRLQFIGFLNMPTDIMRITQIQYTFQDPGSGGMVCSINCSKLTDLQQSGNYQSIIDEIQQNYNKLIQSTSNSSDSDKSGVVIATSQNNTLATVQLRSTGVITKQRSYGLRNPN